MRNVGLSQKIILTYFLSMAFVSIAILIWLLLSPSEPGNSILFGLSLPRLILAMGFFIAFLLFAGLSIRAATTPEWAQRFREQWFDGKVFSRVLFWLAAISLGLGWTGCFLPSYRAGFLSGYWDRIQPIAVFLLCIGLGTLLLFLASRINFS